MGNSEDIMYLKNMKQVKRIIKQGGQTFEFDISDNKISSTIMGKTNETDIDGAFLMDGAGYDLLVARFPLAEGYKTTFNNYDFDLMDGGGWEAYFNSIRMAIYCAVFGSGLIFFGSYLVEKARGVSWLRTILHLIAMMPLAIPGLVLGIAYIFFFNHPDNPLGFLYGTMGILVISTIVHFYTVSHLTSLTALKQLDPEFETVSLSLKTPVWRTFGKVTLPVCLPALLDVASYLFLNAMTTVAAVVFLYSPETMLASIAVLNMDDAGDIAPAAAMALMIVYTSAIFRLLHALLTRYLKRRTQVWRNS